MLSNTDLCALRIQRLWRRHCITLRNKCLFISLFDAIAFQYPQVLKKHNLLSPLALTRHILCDIDFSGSDKFNSMMQWMRSGSGWDARPSDVRSSIILFMITCNILGLKMNFERFNDIDNDGLSGYNESVGVQSDKVLLHIHSTPAHAWFVPFAFVRTKSDQVLYEQFATTSKLQVNQEAIREQNKLREEFMQRLNEESGDESEDESLFELLEDELPGLLK